MTEFDHINKVKRLAQSALEWEAQDDTPEVCRIDGACRCPTCGLVTEVVRGNMVARGWSREAVQRRITVRAPDEASYPYVASVRVDEREVYRVMDDLAEVFKGDVLDDIEAALERQP
jgi:hypothetical protein